MVTALGARGQAEAEGGRLGRRFRVACHVTEPPELAAHLRTLATRYAAVTS